MESKKKRGRPKGIPNPNAGAPKGNVNGKKESPKASVIHMRVEPITKAAFKDAAKSKGLSLSDWLLEAGFEKMAVDNEFI